MTFLAQHLGAFLTLAEATMLSSPWKPIVLLLPFIPWAWIVSKIFDKHAARFYLPREQWNAGHLIAGCVALGAAVALPVEGEAGIWAAFGLVLLILGADIAIFVLVTNKDERVPESGRLTLDFSKYAEARKAKDAAKKQSKVELVLRAADKSVLAPPAADAPDFAVRTAAETAYLKALEARASQIDLLPTGKDNSYVVSYLVDGVRQNGDVLPGPDAIKIIDMWKTAAKLDTNERRKRQQADLTVERADTKKKVRLTSIGGQTGLRLTWLIDPEGQVRRKFDQLGLLEPQFAELTKMVTEGRGIILLGGGPDGGRTTTFYTVLRMHDAYTQNVQTVELEVQDSIEGGKQNKWDPQAEGPEYSTLVRSILRRDPDVLGISELPDANTAKEIVRTDVDRVRIYVSMRAENALQAVQSWAKLHGEPEAASKGLQGVVCQKLVRKLCTNCRVAYPPSPEMLKKMGLPADRVKQLFKKGGQVLIKNKPETCPVCQGVGYQGQEGIFEIFPLGDEERAAVSSGDLNGLRMLLRKKNYPTLQQAAIKKALDGVTSVEEIMRVTAEAQPAPAPAAPAAAAPKKA
jgi:type II secretory ATPase GspE/PulE/Tfp pilus assembly ATPase PilB-like protein